MPCEVLWETGAQEGIIGRQHLERWSVLLERSGSKLSSSKEENSTYPVASVAPDSRLESHMFQKVSQGANKQRKNVQQYLRYDSITNVEYVPYVLRL